MKRQIPHTLLMILVMMLAGALGVNAKNPHAQTTLHDITLRTGVTLQYAERGQGNGQVIIFLHGYLDSWFSFSTVMENLPGKYHAYSLTQRGHGDSDKPASGYSMTDFSEDVAEFMRELGIHKAHIVGHSMGSIIAQRFAIDHPEKVKKLVLIGSGADITSNGILLDFEAFVAGLNGAPDRAAVEELQFSTIVGEAPVGFMDSIVDESMKAPLFVWLYALMGLNDTNHLGELQYITAPTLIAWGDHDEIFPYSDQLDQLNGIQNSSLLIYDNTGHSIHWEKPLQFTLDLIDFLEPAP